MRYINKVGGGGAAWDKFASVKNVGNKDIADSEKLPEFDKAPSDATEGLRQTLAEQQGYLCAFCMAPLAITEDANGNIVRHNTKIAHLISQAAPKGADATEKLRRRLLEVDQHNLVLACMGKNSPLGHCDEKQKSKDVKIPFGNAGIMQHNFSFSKAGLVISVDAAIRLQIGAEKNADDKSSTLNLNNPALCRSRLNAIESLSLALQQKNDYSVAALTAKCHYYTQADQETGRLPGYCELLARILVKKIQQAGQRPAKPQSAFVQPSGAKRRLRRF